MAWGSSSLRSCASLLERLERNDASLIDLYILPTKQVTSADWERCCKAISQHGVARHVRAIHASGHAIEEALLPQISAVLYATGKDVSWEELAIGDANMGDNGVIALVADWKPDFRLSSLDLSYKSLRSVGLRSLLQWASSSKFLKKIDLSRNTDLATGLTADQLQQVLSSDTDDTRFPALEQVILAECNLEGESGAAIISSMARVPTLQVLDLSRNPLGPQGPATSLGSAESALLDLKLASCAMTDVGIISIMPGLSLLPHLQRLDLSCNGITVEGASCMANALAHGWKAMESLNLTGNPIHDAGIDVLIRQGLMLRQQNGASRLLSLDLSQTKCGSAGACLAIQSSHVEDLRLFDNALSSDGFTQLSPALQGGHASLQSLDLAGNGASEEAVVTLLRSLMVTDSGVASVLRTLVVGGNQGGPDLEAVIQELKEVHPELDIARDRIRKK
jgi:Ran GTPase-activating protein (RanGAP) involved in mRNA processing and transport